MIRFSIAALLICTLHARETLTIDNLQAELRRYVSHERFAAAMWGIKVTSLDTGAVLFETNSAKLLKPASNAKLYTGALALDRFGPDYRIRTSLYARRTPGPNGVLDGDLIVFGRGDPSISARFNGGSYSNLLTPLVSELKRAGVRAIRGDLIGDETYFTGARLGAGWAWDDLPYYYGAEISALTIQDNVVDLTFRPGEKVGAPVVVDLRPETGYLTFSERPVTVATNQVTDIQVWRELGSREARLRGTLALKHRPVEDAITVPNPALWFVTLLRDRLDREGIKVAGTLRTRSWPEKPQTDYVEIGAVESKPLSEILRNMLQPSQNLYAQLLLLQAGADGDPKLGSEDRGIAALRQFLKRANIDPREVLLEEGSGLSRASLVTPNATAALLAFMARHEHRALFEESLPEPGVGTLRRRLLDLKGRLRAKTGSLRYVNTLSGYLTTNAGERLAFSIMLNAYNPAGAASGRDELDPIPRLLANLGQRTRRD